MMIWQCINLLCYVFMKINVKILKKIMPTEGGAVIFNRNFIL